MLSRDFEVVKYPEEKYRYNSLLVSELDKGVSIPLTFNGKKINKNNKTIIIKVSLLLNTHFS